MRLFFLFILLTVSLSFLSEVRAEWWKNKSLQSEIRITEKQLREIENIFQEFQKKRQSVLKEINLKLKNLDNLMSVASHDEKKISSLVEEINTLRANNLREQVNMKLRIKGILTSEQLRVILRKYPDTFKASNRWAKKGQHSLEEMPSKRNQQ